MEKRSPLLIKLHSAQRHFVWNHFQPLFDHIRIAEFPKSGGTWLGQMISGITGLDFPRNSSLPLKRCIQHGHHKGPSKYKTIVLIRDGRDVLTSAYFHFLIHGEKKHEALIKQWRKKVDASDFQNVQDTMPTFIKTFHKEFKVSGTPSNWGDYVLSYEASDENTLIVKYEDLLLNANEVLKKILNWYDINGNDEIDQIVEKYSFKNQSQRNPGQENVKSFLRKGVAGDWRNYFNQESEELINRYYGEALRKYDYV